MRGGFNRRLLVASNDATQLSHTPVVVRRDERARRIVQFQGRIGQDTSQTSARQGGTDRAHNDVPRIFSPVMMNPAIKTLSPVCTARRVEMFRTFASGVKARPEGLPRGLLEMASLKAPLVPSNRATSRERKVRDIQVTIRPKNYAHRHRPVAVRW